MVVKIDDDDDDDDDADVDDSAAMMVTELRGTRTGGGTVHAWQPSGNQPRTVINTSFIIGMLDMEVAVAVAVVLVLVVVM